MLSRLEQQVHQEIERKLQRIKDDRYIKRWFNKKSAEEIANALHVKAKTIRVRALKLGFKTPHWNWTAEDDAFLRNNYRWGARDLLTSKFQRSWDAIQKRASRLKITNSHQ